MKASPASLLHRVSAQALAAAVFALSSTAYAATYTWVGSGTTNSWGLAANWNPTPTFNNTADLVFDTLTRPNNFIGADRTIRSITYGPAIDGTFQSNIQDFSGGAARNLTMDADTGNATITVDSGATGNITLGNAGGAGSFGNLVLADNLDVIQNGSGTLLINRPVTGVGFGITKSGTGTLELRAFNTFTGVVNINQGTLMATTSSTNGLDLNNASSVNLGGGALQVRPNSNNKTYDTVPVNVTAASTLSYENTSTTNYTLSFSGTNAFALGHNLNLNNISTDTTLVNAINISRAITGTGSMIVNTYNSIASTSDNFGLGRVLLSGNNNDWSGNIQINKGTVSLSGSAVNAAGTGSITLGTTSGTAGAGLTFFPTGATNTTITYANDITVTSGGFRAIKGGNTNHNVTLTGDITLDGNLNVDHTWSTSDRRLSLNGAISGTGGLIITRAGGNAGTTLRLGGTNTYTGDTIVSTGASLAVAGSLTSDISVANGARLGGGGSTTGDLSMASGANFIFSIAFFDTFDVSGTVTLDNSFGIASLVGGSQGEAIDWSLVPDATYTLIGTTASTFDNITNFGEANKVEVIAGKYAYFQNGGLQLVVVPEPSTALLLVGSMGMLTLLRRRVR